MKSKGRPPTAPHLDLFMRAPTQRRMWCLLSQSGAAGKDVEITRLYRAQFKVERPFRLQQQYVGSVVHNINVKIAARGLVVKLGKRRRTYRLYRL